MREACPMVEDTAMLDEAFQRMQETECPIALVTKNDRLIGVLSLENVGEYMMIATMTNAKTAGSAIPLPPGIPSVSSALPRN